MTVTVTVAPVLLAVLVVLMPTLGLVAVVLPDVWRGAFGPLPEPAPRRPVRFPLDDYHRAWAARERSRAWS